MTTVREALVRATQTLRRAEVACADYADHASRLLRDALNLDAAGLLRRLDERLDADEAERLDAWLKRRTAGEPLQYIAGKAPFWDADFAVGPGCLIPRPETERLVGELLLLETRPDVHVAELGAGSGCIGIASLRERPHWQWHAFERSPEAAAFARRNAEVLLRPEHRYHLYEDDFFVTAERFAPYDWIVSNPPYVPRALLSEVSGEVRREPMLALDGGPDGLDVIRPLVAKAREWLRPQGGLLMEIDESERRSVPELFESAGFDRVTTYADYAGLPRVVYGRWNG